MTKGYIDRKQKEDYLGSDNSYGKLIYWPHRHQIIVLRIWLAYDRL